MGNMLPSYSSKDRYIELRLRRLAQDYDKLEFMQAERKRQKAKERMGTTNDSVAKQESSQQNECQNCGKKGHRAADCRRPKNANKRHGTQPKDDKKSHYAASQPSRPPCPACNLQHSIPAKDNRSKFFKTRLHLWPTFKNISIQEETTVVEKTKACVLCLD